MLTTGGGQAHPGYSLQIDLVLEDVFPPQGTISTSRSSSKYAIV